MVLYFIHKLTLEGLKQNDDEDDDEIDAVTVTDSVWIKRRVAKAARDLL